MIEQNIKVSDKSILQLKQVLRKNLEAVDQEIISRLNKSIPLIRGEEKTARMNEENIADREKLIGKIEQLISTIKNE